MTDLATQSQAGEASAEDDDQAQQAVESDETAVETEPADEPEGAVDAEQAVEAEPVDEPEEAVESAPADEAEQADEAEAEQAEPADEAKPDAAATAVLATPAATTPVPPLPSISADAAVYAWAPAEPKAKRRRTGLWVTAAAGVAVVGLVVSSLVLIAPGTTVAGVPVGWLTPGAAADAIDRSLAETTVVIAGEDGDVQLTGAELGATVDAQALADAAFAEHPMWNVTSWFQTTDAEVALDAATATAALSEAVPQLYTDPVDATLAFDPASASYVVTPAVPGTGIDLATVQAALQDALMSGARSADVEPVAVEIPAGISTETADTTVAQLNGMLDTAGFYVGEERTVPIDRATLAGWLSVAPDTENGAFAITADSAAIQTTVDGLAEAINRPVENGSVITNSAGKVLREEAPGLSGRELGDTSGVASDFAAQLATGNAVFAAPVTETAPEMRTLARTVEVNLSTQTAYLFENGNVVGTYAISSGRAATPTPTGHFTVNAYTRIQDLGALCYNPEAENSYCTEDVPWITWFAPDIAFHGTYWHNNFGTPMSHGCVNMTESAAKFVYDWTARGTEVWVHH